MPRWRPALAVLASLVLAACGGGGGGDDGPNPPPGTFTVSGTISAAAGQVMDLDTGDALDVPKDRRNDDRATAQLVSPPGVVAGWAGVNAAVADTEDWYRVSLAAGQSAVLSIADPGADLDLCLHTAAGALVECSDSLTQSETVPRDGNGVLVAGEYLLQVQAWDAPVDHSNYGLVVGVTTAAAAAEPGVGEFVPGEVLVRFRDEPLGPRAARAASPEARIAALGLEVRGSRVPGAPMLIGIGDTPATRALSLAALGVSATPSIALGAILDPVEAARSDTRRAVKALRARPDVLSADPNFVFRPSLVPANEYYRYQWHYPLINLPQAWDVTRGTASVTVAVLDTGVFLAHPDLAGQLVDGYDFISSPASAADGNGRDDNPNDEGDEATPGASSWHGTHVAGTVAARWRIATDAKGAAGIAPEARVMPLRVLGIGGGTSADINEALRYAAGLPNATGRLPSRRADIVNLSLGCLNCFSATDQAVYAQVRNAGVIVVAAAGNENTTSPGYPASYDGVVSVSAVDLNQAKAPYSNSGPNVDVAAPGGNTGVDLNGDGFADGVLSAAADDSGPQPVPEWRFYQGTSMASPHVAGVLALMKSVCPDAGVLTPARIDELLVQGALTRDLGAAGKDPLYGHGLIDALAAVQAAAQACSAPVPAGVRASPATLDFGARTTPLTLQLTTERTGTGDLSITSVATTADWLTVDASGAGVDGFGSYSVTATPGSLPPGRYSAVIRFSRSDSKPAAEVPVTMQVGSAEGPGDAGFLYVLLLPAADPVNALAQLQGSGAEGHYPYSFTGVPAGSYLIVAGTDSDNDNLICDEGEVCGAWPTLGLPTPLEVGANQPGRDFGVALDLGLGTLRAGEGAPGGGWRKLPAGTKSFGGGR